MRFLHLADLHFGKSLHGRSLLAEDQTVWAERFLELAASLRPDAVVIAGDVYDRGAPAAEAVDLLSRFLTGLCDLDVPVLLIPGNHDSAQRLAFGRELLSHRGLHIAAPLSAPGRLERVTLADEHGPVTFWLMPYVFPALIANALGDESLRDYDGAVRALLDAQGLDFSARNVLIAHQNVTAGGREVERGGSETMVGGVGQIDYTAFDGFDYAALGHIHAGYWVGRKEVRYAGSPLCYHFNEAKQAEKGPVLVTLGAKGAPVQTEVLHIPPLHPLKPWKGTWAEIRALAEQAEPNCFVSATLTDRRLTPEICDELSNLLEQRDCVLLERSSVYRQFTTANGQFSAGEARERSLPELFTDFYRGKRDGADPSDEERALIEYAAELIAGSDGPEADAALAERLLRRAKEAGR